MLNPNAKEFVPSSSLDTSSGNQYSVSQEVSSAWMTAAANFDFLDLVSEENITPEDLEEIEAAEAWVETMAMINELEMEHMIEVAMRYAPQSKIQAIQTRYGLTVKQRGKKSRPQLKVRSRDEQ